MTQMAKVKKVSPMLAVTDMDGTIQFYRDVLGFVPLVTSPDYVIAERDGQTIHFQKAESEDVMAFVRGHIEIYVEVTGIASLWEHVKGFKEQHRVRDLFDRPYGMTEFHIEDPNGCLVLVGERTGPKNSNRNIIGDSNDIGL